MDTLADHLDRLRQRLLASAPACEMRPCAHGCHLRGGADDLIGAVCLVGRRAAVKERYDANRAALSQARRIIRHTVHVLTDLGEDAFTIIAQPDAPTTVAR